ncbi:MAG: hypothetical protein M0R34_04865 [Candidatus Marinimicrobia bacterium]|jgi:hypothetical protein|nr:hypothetical protein [Candidatus Neomarinimicrobiota bacterium]MCK9483673.1 hypothetical protein [Candidatus Neomarinimicrobiota bacterium]MCK9559606.1 hypothetical protein [Candidatus Neomarinimicrobiota bacterium]MDD5061330.1 hypothetical protein [Candidatus Neomarinimicrobiota bacterium]MDD5229955.1 hypothetical protein [Candidatus Neomarinimicrobiota bacterium]
MAEKVVKCGVKKEKGYLYYLDKAGNVARSKMARGGNKGGGAQVIQKCGVKRQEGYLYFIDKNGDVSRAKMARGRK